MYPELIIEGRNPVMEALRSGRKIDRIYIKVPDNSRNGENTGKMSEDGSGIAHTGEVLPQETVYGRKNHYTGGIIGDIVREASKNPGIKVRYVSKAKLDGLCPGGRHQGVIAFAGVCQYSDVDDILNRAYQKGEDPFLFMLDGIEDPHNLGAIVRTANLCGAHGVIIRNDRAASITSAALKASAGALNYTPVARVTNLARTIEELKQKGIWFVCADMGGQLMYDLNLKGPVCLVIGNEGKGVSRLVSEKCDMTAAIPMKGDIDSLNASAACAVLAFEIVRQRMRI